MGWPQEKGAELVMHKPERQNPAGRERGSVPSARSAGRVSVVGRDLICK